MTAFFTFLIGLILGGGGAWVVLDRKLQQRLSEIEENWKVRLKHAQTEVSRADSAHEETKERLRRLQQEHQEATTRLQTVEAELDEARTARSDAEERAGDDAARTAELERRLRSLEAELEKARAEPARGYDAAAPNSGDGTAPPSPARPSGDSRSRRIKAIDAKLAQLPAGSSARQKLLEERRSLSEE